MITYTAMYCDWLGCERKLTSTEPITAKDAATQGWFSGARIITKVGKQTAVLTDYCPDHVKMATGWAAERSVEMVARADEWLNANRRSDVWRLISELRDEVVRMSDARPAPRPDPAHEAALEELDAANRRGRSEASQMRPRL